MTDEKFIGMDTLKGKEVGAVVRGTGTLVVLFRCNETLLGGELTAVLMGNAALDRFAEIEGSPTEGEDVADTEVELDTAPLTAGRLGGAGI